MMSERTDPPVKDSNGSQQRYFKLTPKARAPKVMREWPAEENPWYYYYILDFILIAISIPIIIVRMIVPDDGWVASLLEFVLIAIFIHVIMPQDGQ